MQGDSKDHNNGGPDETKIKPYELISTVLVEKKGQIEEFYNVVDYYIKFDDKIKDFFYGAKEHTHDTRTI